MYLGGTNEQFSQVYCTGQDCIGPRLLKMASDILSPGVTFIIKKSITSGIFPTICKQAEVNPLFKNGARDELNDYIPI